jgi:HPt (histidine-containing phosphotransfer) domain-containing protein
MNVEAVEIDLDRMSEVASGCGWTFAELVEFYVPRARQEIAAIDEALEAGDRETVARLTHGAAGSNATVGIDCLAARFRAISDYVRQPPPTLPDEQLATMIAKLDGHLALVLARLDELVGADR